ncbi:MAG: nucleoside triphosphate pyrophosphohydrolase [Candidatus Eisenbacteria bacterium]|uniref:Nucleoside triphosphate pyrophosphohydrolase n=1 Tax=Eiseniibacteriota bacterium TaxID=2212470 RepID=A0A956M1K4_UNCEI|nr:nucleoside triphosphate pyrophosphohydrolase [Candidatus Eisenbacteria bacterium]
MSDPPSDPDLGFESMLALCRTLRGPEGCPWDRAQTVRSLARYLVEESFEALQAAETAPGEQVEVELGDLAFVLALTLITAESEGGTAPAAVLARAIGKIRRRHPHVFADAEPQTTADLWRLWEANKQEETGASATIGHLTEPDPALPALIQSRKLQERAAAVGFDWPQITPVIEKIREELGELEAALDSDADRREELGDLLFATVNLARFLDVDPEAALRSANTKFRRRFNAVVDRAHTTGRNPEDLSLAELDDHWEAVKKQERG